MKKIIAQVTPTNFLLSVIAGAFAYIGVGISGDVDRLRDDLKSQNNSIRTDINNLQTGVNASLTATSTLDARTTALMTKVNEIVHNNEAAATDMRYVNQRIDKLLEAK